MMDNPKSIFGYLFIFVGVIKLIMNLFSSITVPGLETVNLSLLHDSISGAIWGFGFVIIGMLFLILENTGKKTKPTGDKVVEKSPE